MFLLLFVSFFFFSVFFKNFKSKLILLLTFEMFYIFCIFYVFNFGELLNMHMSFLSIMMLFMVLDSVLGLSILISVSRDSSQDSWNYFAF